MSRGHRSCIVFGALGAYFERRKDGMAIVGVVVRWTEDLEARRAAQARLAADPRVERGPDQDDRSALVVEGSTSEIDAWLADLARWPAVALVSPVFHDFEDELPNHG